jgi:L-lactate dehydrogenase complex protein LldE
VRVAIFATCLGDQLFPDAVVASVRLLRWLGVAVTFPEAQTCCGQPAFNAGHHAEARSLARHHLRVFAGSDPVVAPSGSCAAMVRCHYPPLLEREAEHLDAARALAARTHDLASFVTDVLGVSDVGADLAGERVTYHDGCHALRLLGVSEAPRRLLRGAGATLCEAPGHDVCCGFGGLFAVKHPEVSAAIAAAKHPGIDASGAATLTSQDAGCLMQLAGSLRRTGRRIRTVHLAELLWDGIARANGQPREGGSRAP